jgi:Peptidase U49
MPRIDRSCLSAIKSPIRIIMAKIADTVFTIAPERKSEFETGLGNFDLILVNQRAWKFCADPVRREIFVSRGAVELIWSASLAHFAFYTGVVQGKRFDQETEIDPKSDARVGTALSLLRWALLCQLSHQEADDWPNDLPRPLVNPAAESDENVADEICLATAAYLLHHELAHIRLGHRADVSDDISISQEKDADIAAADWVIGRMSVADKRFLKRLLGIVQAMVLTTAYGLYGGCLGGQRHPFSYDRLSSLLSRFLGDTEHLTKAFAFAVLSLHLQNSGRHLRKQEFTDFGEALEEICDQLACEVHMQGP